VLKPISKLANPRYLQLVFRVRAPTIIVRIADNLINCIIGVEICESNSWRISIQSFEKTFEKTFQAGVKQLDLLVHLWSHTPLVYIFFVHMVVSSLNPETG
jgi:hypothetical protein